MQMHGTTIAIKMGPDGQACWVAAMIRGPSGSGKSDLALRCLAQPLTAMFPLSAQQLGVQLVADDRTDLTVTSAATGAATIVTAHAPTSIAGLLEVRGLGIVTVPHVPSARLILIADLVSATEVQRYPVDESTWGESAGGGSAWVDPISNVAKLPRYVMYPFEPSSPLKLLLALARTALTGSPVGADAAKHHCLPEGQ
jgi:HPr kinase/phosphorylase